MNVNVHTRSGRFRGSVAHAGDAALAAPAAPGHAQGRSFRFGLQRMLDGIAIFVGHADPAKNS